MSGVPRWGLPAAGHPDAVTTSREITEALAEVMAFVRALAASKRRTSFRCATQWTYWPALCLGRRVAAMPGAASNGGR